MTTFTSEQIRDAVYDFGGACEDGKEAWIRKHLGISLVAPKFTVKVQCSESVGYTAACGHGTVAERERALAGLLDVFYHGNQVAEPRGAWDPHLGEHDVSRGVRVLLCGSRAGDVYETVVGGAPTTRAKSYTAEEVIQMTADAPLDKRIKFLASLGL